MGLGGMKGKENKGKRMGNGAGGLRFEIGMVVYSTYQSHRLINDIPRLPQETNYIDQITLV